MREYTVVVDASNQAGDGVICLVRFLFIVRIAMKIIAKIETDFSSKFGVPRQSGLVAGLSGRVIFEPEYRKLEAVRGLEQFSHIWLLWEFSQTIRESWTPTVRPPRLGGNTRMGVFATRSPFRPNPIGLSSVKLEKIQTEAGLGPVLYVSGVDMTDQTPVFDIKPYLPYVDSHEDAVGGFTDEMVQQSLAVEIPEKMLGKIPEEQRQALVEVLAQDPRPSYQQDSNRIYGMEFAQLEVKFMVRDNVLTVCDVTEK